MSSGERHFVFTITTGRSGSNFLADLLALNLEDAQVHHEQLAYSDWGVNTPDVSHMTTFNQIGNNRHLREFWKQKLARIKALDVRYFAEAAHMLAKAGLLENIGQLDGAGTVHLVYLKRDIANTVISLIDRGDFRNKGNQWLWYLDPRYANVIVSPQPFLKHGRPGIALWYVIEMRVRAEYYRILLAGRSNIRFHEVEMEEVTRPDGAARLLADLGTDLPSASIRLPGRVNANKSSVTDARSQQHIRELVGKFPFDAAGLARRWHDSGRRLAALPKPTATREAP